MNTLTTKSPGRTRTTMLLAGCLTMCTMSHGADFYLRTGVITNTMPDGRSVVMWAFAQDTAFHARDGILTVPGPALTVPPGDNSLTIHLDNQLQVPVSVVIPGLMGTTGPVPTRSPVDGRALSFTHEAAPGNVTPENYSWTNLSPGTHLYFSGSHSAVQVQMGLYGAIEKDAASGQAYTGVPYTRDAILLFSEVDPALHDAVATDNYGTNKAMTSTVNYLPKYFLINGTPYTNGLPHIQAGGVGDNILLRILNAGLELRTPTLNGAYVQLVAEDGNRLPYPRQTYTMPLPPLTTLDAVWSAGKAQSIAIYDRRLGLANGATSSGGMLTYLDVNLNLILPANGGVLRSYTSQNSTANGAAKLTDRVTGAGSYWMSSASPAIPQSFTYSFAGNNAAVLNQAVVYNYGQTSRNRYSKGFHIDVSSDGASYTVVTNGVLASNETAQAFDLRGVVGNYVRLVVTNGYNTNFWELSEFQVYGLLVTDTTPPVPGLASSPVTTNASPIIVSYTGALDTGGSGLVRVELWCKKGASGTWFNTGLTRAGASGSFNFTGMTGNDTYYFGLTAVDGAGNRSAGVSGSGDCNTVYTGPVALINLVLPANGGALRTYTSQYSAALGAAKLTDGATGAAGYWRSIALPARPQSFVYSFSNNNSAVMSQAVIYNYGEGTRGRYSRAFHIDVSTDGVNYAVVTNSVLTTNETAQTFDLHGVLGKYVRLVINSGYKSAAWELGEFQVYGAFTGAKTIQAKTVEDPVLVDSSSQKLAAQVTTEAPAVAPANANVSWPHVWSSSDWSPEYAVDNAIDGNTNTAWRGKSDAAPWEVSLDFGGTTNLVDLQIWFWDRAWTNTFVGGSLNGSNDWFDVLSVTNGTIDVRYMLIDMWDDPSRDTPPAIREIIWK